MPATRKKHKSQHQPIPVHTGSSIPKVKRSAALVIAILSGVFGLLIVVITLGTDWLWMIVGAVGGAVIGYLLGHSIDKSIARK